MANTFNSHPVLAAGRADGLGGRLCNLLVTRCFAKKRGLQFLLLSFDLPLVHYSSGKIDDIFKYGEFEILSCGNILSWNKKTIEEKREIVGRDFIHMREWDINSDSNIFNDITINNIMEEFNILYFNSKISENMHFIKNFFSNLKRNLEINLIGIHIRSGDVEGNVKKWYATKFFPLDIYKQAIEKIIKDKNILILVITNNEYIKKLYAGNFQIILASDIINDNTLSKIEQDFLEIYALSFMPKIIAPISSAFARASQYIGGATLIEPDYYVLGSELATFYRKNIKI
jgi:hypothetical protein